ncbi:unnamed protein product [Caretta caretta]
MARQSANVEVLNCAGMSFMGILISKNRHLGYVKRMLDYRIPKSVPYSEACKGSRKRDRPLHRFQDICKDLVSFGISVDDWERSAECCSGWRSQLVDGVRHCEADWIKLCDDQCQRRKESAAWIQSFASVRVCSTCGWDCHVRIELSIHQRTHQFIHHAL